MLGTGRLTCLLRSGSIKRTCQEYINIFTLLVGRPQKGRQLLLIWSTWTPKLGEQSTNKRATIYSYAEYIDCIYFLSLPVNAALQSWKRKLAMDSIRAHFNPIDRKHPTMSAIQSKGDNIFEHMFLAGWTRIAHIPGTPVWFLGILKREVWSNSKIKGSPQKEASHDLWQ